MSDDEMTGFWQDRKAWRQACRNTFQCLIGCSIGDFGTLIWFQHYRPDVSFLIVMPIAMAMGLLTSIILETVLLKLREGMAWWPSLRMAFSMSFLSMLGMELAENITDYLLTKGEVPLNDPFFWIALGISLIAGFLVPLPYNYYKFRKHGRHCH